MNRKPRIDSAAAQVAVMQDRREIVAPAHVPLEKDAGPFWSEIVAARSREEWTPHDLAFAADLANTMAMLADNRRKLRDEGSTSISKGGNPTTNPRVGVVNSLHAQVKAARQSLGLHSAARGDQRDVLNRRAKAKHLEDVADATDDLIARPPTVQ